MSTAKGKDNEMYQPIGSLDGQQTHVLRHVNHLSVKAAIFNCGFQVRQ